MSYILDALRRAESERDRERGGVPGLNAQPVPAGSLELSGSRRSRAWIWVAVGVTLGLAVPLTWRFLGSNEPASGESPGVRATVSGNVIGQAPLPTPTPAPVTPEATASVMSSATPPAPPAATMPPPAAAPPTAPPPIKSPPRAIMPKAAVTVDRPEAPGNSRQPERTNGVPTLPPQGPAPQRAAPAPTAPLPRLAELPDDVRRDVPALAFGGSIYSELPAQRMVILNGQVLREGESITGDLAVDEIRPKSAVLRVKGRRFELVF